MQEKSINRYYSYCRSLANLKEARFKDSSDLFVLSGTVHMFNLSFDLAWKVMKDIITQYHGVLDYPTGSPRETLRMARSVGLIDDDLWVDMLRVRNHLAHDYDGALAVKYFQLIISEYYDKMELFKWKALDYYKKEE